MILNEFILQRRDELIASGLYRNVKFKSATDIGLRRNGTTQNFLTTNSNINKTGEEVKDFSLLPTDNVDDNGSEVEFEVLPKGKRKYRAERFYFLYA